MNETSVHKHPRWLRDLIRFLPLKSQFVLSGNVRDLQVKEGAGRAVPQRLTPYLSTALYSLGYSHVLIYDPVNGFSIDTSTAQGGSDSDAFMKKLGLQPSNGRAPAGIDLFEHVLEQVSAWDGAPIVLIVDFASRLAVRQDSLTAAEYRAFTRALILSHQARPRPYGESGKPYFNNILWLVDKEGDLPDWLVIDNPRIRHIPIPLPDHHARRTLATSLIRSLDGVREAPSEAIETAVKGFVEGTEGLLLVDLTSISQLCRDEGLSYSKIGEAVRRYKVGVAEDPWQKIDRQKICEGKELIMDRVKGQDHAVMHMLDIVKRAITGVGTAGRGERPRGVAFLAGPTGVGKTELAKAITSLLFGDDSAYIRFDMSEFSAEHSDQRLIGAPPGYVGYDVGGELTNAIREKPFSVVLFDEIEKAHPRILDKFLQILDDGVLTSGRGDRVYFSEAFIIFTSNLGIYRTDSNGERALNVSPADRFETIRDRVRNEIEQHFKVTLNRPEILNRIGDNIIIFDFIRDKISERIFDSMIESTFSDLAVSQNIHVGISPTALETLRKLCLSDLSNGGRGIRNKLETHLVNPLSRSLFDANTKPGNRIYIDKVIVDFVTQLQLTLDTPIVSYS